MATTKGTILTFPRLEGGLRTAAARERRSIANMVEVLIRGWCGRNGIMISEQAAFSEELGGVGVYSKTRK